MRSHARGLRNSRASAKPGSLFSICFSLLILVSLIAFPRPAIASQDDIEKSFQNSLHQSKDVVKKAKEKHGKGKPIHDEIASLKAQAEDIKASHQSLLEKFSKREEEMSSLGLPPKAFERHQAMVDEYKEAVNEYLGLIENLSNKPSVISGQLKKIEIHLDKNLHKKKTPIHGSLPYRNLGYPARNPDASPAIKPAYKGGDAAVRPDDTKSTAEAPISPEIAALAQSLNWNPVSIYEYVKNSIETEWYWGCMKGAEETLSQSSGNDCDQAAVLIALLRASGFPSRYVRGTIEFLPDISKAKNLTGIDDPWKIAEFFQKSGIPFKPIIAGGKITNFMIEHIWVESYIPYANYRGAVIDEHGKTWLGLDTSIKVKDYQYNSPVDLFQQSAVRAQLSGMRDEYLTAIRPETPLEYLRNYLNSELEIQNPELTYNDLLMTKTLAPEIMNILPASMQFNQKTITHEYTEIPDELKHRVRIIAADPRSSPTAGPMFDITLNAMKLSNKQTAISYEPETVEDQQIINAYGGLDNTPAYLVRLRPVLKVEGERLAVGRDGLPMGADNVLTVEMISPNGTESVSNTHITGNLAALGIVSQNAINSEETKLTEEDGAEEILFKESNRYIDKWNQAEDELASLLHLPFMRPIPTVVTVGGVIDVAYVFGTPHKFMWKGVFCDANLRAIEITPSNSPLPQGGEAERQKTFMQLAALQGSALEHKVFEDDWQVEFISTAKLMQIVNTMQPAPEIFTIDSTNIDDILATLPFDEGIKEDISNAVNQNLTIRIPNSEIAYKDWTGIGYIKEDITTGETGYMLSGMIAGGMTAIKKQDWISQDLASALSLPYSQKINEDPNSVVKIARLNRTADYQPGIVGTNMKTAYQVIALDSNNRPVQGVNITFKVVSGGGQVQGEDKAGNITAPLADQVSVITGADGIARARLTLGKYTSASVYLRPDTDAAGNTYWEQTGLNLVAMSAQAQTATISTDKPFEAYGKPAEAVSIEKIPSPSAGGTGLYSGYIWVKIIDKYGNSISNKKVYYEIMPQIFSGAPPTAPADQIQNAKLFKKPDDCPGVATINCPNLLPNADNPANPIEFTSSYNGAIAYLVLGNTDNTTYTIKVNAKQDYFDQKGERIDTAADIADIKPAPPAEFTYKLGNGSQTYLRLFHLQHSDDKGHLIDAGAAGTEFTITTQMFKFAETEGVYDVSPVNDGTVSFSICPSNTFMGCLPSTSQGSFDPQSVTNIAANGSNYYSTKLTLGDEPGLLYIRAGGNAPGVTSTWAPIFVWNVKTSITAVPAIQLNDDGYPIDDTEITYTIEPADYNPATIDVDFYENDEYMGMIQGTRDSAILSQGFAKFDPLFTYTFEVVLNRGPYEMRSERMPLDLKSRLCPVNADCCGVKEPALSSVDLTLGEYNDESVDMAVKAQGHKVEVIRRFYDNDWHFDHLSGPVPVYADEVIVYINADGVRYSKAYPEGTVFNYIPDPNYGPVRTISVNGEGYLWKDSSGNWRQYDTSGRLLSYGNSNNIKVSFIYEPGEDGKLIGVSDNSGSQALWYEYNADGKISAVRDSSSRRVTYTYTGGNLTKVTDVLGNETSYQYDEEGRLVHKNNAAGKSANITYNEDGLVTSVTAGDGTGKFFEDLGAYSRITSSSGRTKDVWIDSAGNRTREDINSATDYTVTINGRTKIIKDAGGRQTTKEYDAQHNLITVTHPDGSVERFTYEPLFNKPLSRTDELGRITEYTYDTTGNMTKMVEAKGTADERITEYTYDALSNLITIKILGDPKTAQAVTGMSYDQSGNVRSITDPEGGITNFTYDIMGNIVTKVDALGKTWGYEYNDMGWLTKTTDPLGNIKNFVYDAIGNKIQETDEEGKVKTFEYDMHNNLVKSTEAGNVTLFEYDNDKNLTKRTDPDGKIVTFKYDLDGHLVKTTDGNGNNTLLEYDNSGSGCPVCSGGGDADQPKKIIFPTFSRTYTYDSRNRKTVEEDMSGADTFTTRFTYDTTGNLIAVSDKESRNTSYQYDALNRLIRETDPAVKVIEYTYDDRGNLLSLKDPKNGITQFEYDRNNRLVKEIRPMGEATTYTYDSAGNLIRKTDAENRKIENTYDSAGKLITSNFKDASGSTTKSVTYAYDRAGHLTSYNDGVTSAQYAYDNAYRMTSGTVNYGTFSKTYSYTYNANSRKKSFTGPDGIAYQYTYDSNNQLTGIQIPGVGNVSYDSYTWTRPNSVTLPGGSTKAYAYDPLMRTRSITDKDPAQAIRMDYQYTYDKMDNVLSKNTEHGNYGYQYDTLYRLANAANPSSSETYTYDAVGNRLTSANVTGSWSYNSNNELIAYDGVSYQYDDNGNMTSKTDQTGATTFTYDIDNRLVQLATPNAQLVTYYYDPFGRRLWKEVGGQRTYFLYSVEGLIGEYDNTGTEIKTYGYKPDSTWTTDPVFMKQGAEYYFYHNDHLGTPMIMTNISGSVVWAATYDLFGKADVNPSSTITNNLRFAGQYYDAETGLHYNYFRYYDPATGRYITTDPIGFMGGDVNLFAYTRNNPVNFIDPSGLLMGYSGAKGFGLLFLESIGGGGNALYQIKHNDPFIKSAASIYGVDPNLIRAIIFEEQSHLIPPIVEDYLYGDTKGLGQISSNVWRKFGEGEIENKMDPCKNIYTMARYLKDLQSRYHTNNISTMGTRYNFDEPKTIPKSSIDYGKRIRLYYNIFNLLGLGVFSFGRSNHRRKKINSALGIISVTASLLLIIAIAQTIEYRNHLNLKEELPIKINEQNIVYGSMQVYHPVTLFKKYRLTFLTKNPIIEKHIPGDGYVDYYYLENIDDIPSSDALILQKDQVLDGDYLASFIKFLGSDRKNYLMTIISNSGSSDIKDASIRLYRQENDHYVLIFDRNESYSEEPNFDSYFCLEKIDMMFRRYLLKDDRY